MINIQKKEEHILTFEKVKSKIKRIDLTEKLLNYIIKDNRS